MLSACQGAGLQSPSIQNIHHSETLSAKCLGQLAVTESRSILAQSPTLTASVDEEGDANVNLRLDAMEFYRAGLNRELTLANCSHDSVVKLVRDISRLSVGRVARNSLLAQASKLSSAASHFQRQTRAMIADGKLEETRAERVFKVIRNMKKQANRALQRGSGLQEINYSKVPTYAELENALVVSLTDVQDKQITADLSRNIRINLTGGVRYDQQESDNVNNEDDETEEFGSVSVSIRLGMFDPRLRRHQQRLVDAEFDELYEPKTGFLWQLQDLHQNNIASEKSLLRERQLVLEELVWINQTLQKEQKPERVLANQISKAIVEADLLRININLKELRIMLDKLAGSQPTDES